MMICSLIIITGGEELMTVCFARPGARKVVSGGGEGKGWGSSLMPLGTRKKLVVTRGGLVVG